MAADYRAPARDYLGWLSPSVSWLIAAASFVLMMVTGMLAAWGTPAEPVPPIHRSGLAPLQQQANALHVLAKAYERLGAIDLATRDTTALLGLYSFARSARRDSSAISTLLVRHGHPRMVDPMGTPPAPPISELPGVRAVPALAGAVSMVDEVLDLVGPVLSFYARSEGSSLRRPIFSTSQAPEITPRQRLILELISEGLTNTSIARRIGFSESLVRHEIMAIFKILGCRTRSDAVTAARGSGLLPVALSS